MKNVLSTISSVRDTSVERGALVEVELAGGVSAERLVWSVVGDVVYVCTAQTYERLSRGESAAQPIGFPVRDVRILA